MSTDAIPVLIDTNVIVDFFYQDPLWEAWSTEKMSRHAGDLIIIPHIYAELCYRADSAEQVDQCIGLPGFSWQDLPKEPLYLAARAYRTYRQRGGVKTAPLPDFFIGAHAKAAGFTLLTRDTARYCGYVDGGGSGDGEVEGVGGCGVGGFHGGVF